MSMRRRDIVIGGLSGIAGLTAMGSSAKTFAAPPAELSLYHIHTGEQLSVIYRENGKIIPDALTAIDHLLRDFRTGQIQAIEVELLDTLSALYAAFDRRGRFEVISGYRSPRTNQALSRITTGIAKNSLHMYGRAIDVRLTSAATDSLRTAALALRRGGVGYYPESNFVHVDTGAVRTW